MPDRGVLDVAELEVDGFLLDRGGFAKNVRLAGLKGDGLFNNRTALQALTPGRYQVPAGVYYTATDTTVPVGVYLHMAQGAVFRPATGTTLWLTETPAADSAIFDITGGGYMKFVAPVTGDARWWGARFDDDATYNSAPALNAALVGVGLQGRLNCPAGSCHASNVLLPVAVSLEGAGNHRTYFYGFEGATGTMVKDSASASKIIMRDMTWDLGAGLYTKILDLGNSGVQFGTEGQLDNVKVRADTRPVVRNGLGVITDAGHLPDVAVDINANVVDIYRLTVYGGAIQLRVGGVVGRAHGTVLGRGGEEPALSASGWTAKKSVEVLTTATHWEFHALHIEAPAASASATSDIVPVDVYADVHIDGLKITLGQGGVHDHLIRLRGITNTTIDGFLVITAKEGGGLGCKVYATTFDASATNAIRFGRRVGVVGPPPTYTPPSGDNEEALTRYARDRLNLFRVPEAVASSATEMPSRTLNIRRGHPSLLIQAESDLTADVVLNFVELAARLSGHQYRVVNNSSWTVWVRGTVTVSVGGLPIALNPAIGFPVRRGATLDLRINAAGAGQGLYSGSSGDLSAYPALNVGSSVNAYFLNEVFYDNTGVGGRAVMKRCTATGTFGGSSPTFDYVSGELRGSAAATPGTIANGTGTNVTVTVPGAVVGDRVTGVSWSAVLPNGVTLFGQVTSANTVSVRLSNASGTSQTIAAGTANAGVTKP
jgi:hypothetical protein